MKKLRIIPRLDIKGPNVVKGIQLEGLRIVGKPHDMAKDYYEQGADEILYIDTVASLYQRNNLHEIVEQTASSDVYIPITVGGGVRSIEDIRKLLRCGADKVAINTAATRDPHLITKASRIFGSQCIVGSIEAKRKEDSWECFVDNGRQPTGLEAVSWARRLYELGAGELLITSIDLDGTCKGLDKKMIGRIVESVDIPVIASGGARDRLDISDCFVSSNCDAVSLGHILHFGKADIPSIKAHMQSRGLAIRSPPSSSSHRSPERPTLSKKTISILDYGAGNLRSVINAFKALSSPVRVVDTAEGIASSELLVLPGDGAFGFGMDELKERCLIEPLDSYVKARRPLLGICLGMQLLLEKSHEFGQHKGLGYIAGEVLPFRARESSSPPDYRIPHMGWNAIERPQNKDWSKGPLQGIESGSEVYFVHSYYVDLKEESSLLATSTYGDQTFCSILKKDNILGTQFHPEKSGQYGMDILRWFSSL